MQIDISLVMAVWTALVNVGAWFYQSFPWIAYYTYAILAIAAILWHWKIVREERLKASRDDQWTYRIIAKAAGTLWLVIAMSLAPRFGFLMNLVIPLISAIPTVIIFQVTVVRHSICYIRIPQFQPAPQPVPAMATIERMPSQRNLVPAGMEATA